MTQENDQDAGLMSWLRDVEFEDLLTGDSQLIFEHCGLDVLVVLWDKLPSLTLYISEKPLFEIKKRYIRKHFNPTDAEMSAKRLAIKMGVSEKFVYEALAATDKKDDRQQSFLKD